MSDIGLGNYFVVWLVIVSILGIINLIVWIRMIIKFRTKGLMLFVCLILLITLILKLWDFADNVGDNEIIGLLIFISFLSFITRYLKDEKFHKNYIIPCLVVLILMLGVFESYVKKDLKIYLQLRLGRTTINLYQWADAPENKINWTDIYQIFKNRELVIESLQLCFNNIGTKSSISKNLSFRDAAFRAWSDYNHSYPDGIYFSDGGIGNSYAAACKNKAFMLWWLNLAVGDSTQENNLIKFLEEVRKEAKYPYDSEKEQAEYIANLKECKSNLPLRSKDKLYNEFTKTIQAVENGRISE
ncbi:MAG: hypothetical protein WBP45_14175 [Daejeonella sp.]